jgi:hypothetical protein
VTADLIDIETQALLDILPRLSAMNSFVRSNAGRRGFGSLHRIVYHYKREALIRGTRLGVVTHAGCTVATTCRDCGGDGRYVDWDGHKHDHCWRCNSLGKAILGFVESTFAEGTVWFSPRDKSWSFCRADELPAAAAAPVLHQVGKDLTAEEIADHLCEIEAFFTKPPDPEFDRDGHRWDYHSTYRLYVGETGDACHLCGAQNDDEQDRTRCCVSTGRLEWTATVCKTCRALYPDAEVFNVLKPKLPAALLMPAVRRWVETHPVVERSGA